MKVEYKKSSLGIGTELHVSIEEYKRVNSEAGWHEREALMFAIRAYCREINSTRRIVGRDLEEAARHIKKIGTIVLATKANETAAWHEIYAITEGEIIPVITSADGEEFDINYSSKTLREKRRIQKERET